MSKGIVYASLMSSPQMQKENNSIVMIELPDGKVAISGTTSYEFLLKCIDSLNKSASIFYEEVRKHA